MPCLPSRHRHGTRCFGRRIYITGTDRGEVAQWLPGYVQAFDIASHSLVGSRVPLGRQLQRAMMSAASGELIVVGHADYFDSSVGAGDPRRNSIVPTVFVLGTTDLAVRRSIAMPYTNNIDLISPKRLGAVDINAATGVVYAADTFNNRFSVVDTVQATLRVVDTESLPYGLAVNPVAQTVLVSENLAGVVAVHSLAGERLDTVPIAAPPELGTQARPTP